MAIYLTVLFYFIRHSNNFFSVFFFFEKGVTAITIDTDSYNFLCVCLEDKFSQGTLLKF